MTLEEIRYKVAETDQPNEYNSLVLNLKFSHINFEISLNGIIAIYEFISNQAAGWNKIQDNLPEELAESKKQFEQVKQKIINLVSGRFSYSLKVNWDDIKRDLENGSRRYFIYESPELDFLIKVYNEIPNSFVGGYRFIINDIRNSNNDKDEIIGSMMAYEFSMKDHSKILERRNSEKGSIGKIRNDFFNYLNESEQHISEYIKRTDLAFEEYSKSIDEIKAEKEKLFSEWFLASQDAFGMFDEGANNKVSDLEKAYEALLSLKKPAEYWNKRATTLKTEGQSFLRWLVGLVLFGCISLYLLLWLTPEGMLLSFIKGQASAIKWSIIYITFISLLAFGIKAISKVMFSSFHLARDAEEREQLTYVYLAMIKDAAIDEKDRSLIMQSLFSRSDTGLLKEDSGPTMPGIIEKVIQK